MRDCYQSNDKHEIHYGDGKSFTFGKSNKVNRLQANGYEDRRMLVNVLVENGYKVWQEIENEEDIYERKVMICFIKRSE